MSDVPPTIRDHPDFMPPEGAASSALIDEGIATTGLYERGLFDVSSWDTLSLRLDLSASAAGPFFVTLNWFSAINGGRGIPIAQRNGIVEAGDAVFYSYPNFGSAVGIIITPLGAAVPWSGGINITARRDSLHNVPGRDVVWLQSGVVAAGAFGFGTVALAAGGGWAAWHYANSASGASAHGIEFLDGAGTFSVLYQREQASLGGSEVVWLPQRKLRLWSFNRAGVAQNLVARLVLA